MYVCQCVCVFCCVEWRRNAVRLSGVYVCGVRVSLLCVSERRESKGESDL